MGISSSRRPPVSKAKPAFDRGCVGVGGAWKGRPRGRTRGPPCALGLRPQTSGTSQGIVSSTLPSLNPDLTFPKLSLRKRRPLLARPHKNLPSRNLSLRSVAHYLAPPHKNLSSPMLSLRSVDHYLTPHASLSSPKLSVRSVDHYLGPPHWRFTLSGPSHSKDSREPVEPRASPRSSPIMVVAGQGTRLNPMGLGLVGTLSHFGTTSLGFRRPTRPPAAPRHPPPAPASPGRGGRIEATMG